MSASERSRPPTNVPVPSSATTEPPRDARVEDPEIERLRAENARLDDEVRGLRRIAATDAATSRHRVRSIGTVAFVVLASVSLVATTVGVWFDRTVWNTDRYVALVGPVADDPAVTNALAARLTTEAFEALDVQARVEDALASIPKLPPSAGFLAGPIVAGTRTVVQRQAEAFLASDAFHNLWLRINETAHQKVVALLEGDYAALPNVSVTGGEVRLNLVSAVTAFLRQLVQRGVGGLGLNVTIPQIPETLDASAAIARLDDALGVSLPADFGQLTVMTEEQLTGYQQAAGNLKRVDGILVLTTVVLIAACLLLALDRRRAAIWLGVGGAIALVVGGAAIRRVEARVVDSIAAPGAKAAAEDVFAQVSASLRGAGVVVGLCALAVAIGAYLIGRPAWVSAAADRVRRATARGPGGSPVDIWVGAHATPLRVATVVLAAIVLFLTGVGWISVLVVAFLVGLALAEIASAERRVVVVP